MAARRDDSGEPAVGEGTWDSPTRLLVDHAKAIAVRQRLREEYPDEPHALCRIWAIWRMKS
jgi:hypothetical protein